MDDDQESLLDQVGPALARMRRRTQAATSGDVLRNVVLFVLADQPRLTVGGLSVEMGVAQPAASRVVADCVATGLVRRQAAADDGRKTVLELTDEGRAEARRLARLQREAFEDITAGWRPSEREDFARHLVRYAADAAAWSRNRS
ncbi:MarR family winged helix-turn-helix transcriptional regulator [Nocardioides sp. Soil774]|uniref:MarR family winged helix-turn-helix transcriptional regulator n=1 Tax=Nocardioides sp. Soil774 TaxID=1736408 RepID=UPI000A850DE8|nr:MarR family winged helix-turn-helix transcriptional regulator [Nocardioides sp. Soil774]